MIRAPGINGKKIAVFGLGRTGLATYHTLKENGAIVLPWDEAEFARETARQNNVKLVDITQKRVWDDNDISQLIVSPGIPHLYPEPHPTIELAMQRGIPIDNDVGLFFQCMERMRAQNSMTEYPKVIAVTGTNGKSTTVTLINHILKAHGFKSAVAGNIGQAVLGLPSFSNLNHIILEVSSYQAEIASLLNPEIAVFLNLAEDHLDRHNGVGGYFAAKKRLFEGHRLEFAVVGVDEPEGKYLTNTLSVRNRPVKIAKVSNHNQNLDKGRVIIGSDNKLSEYSGSRIIDTYTLNKNPSLKGNHNLQNAAASYLVSRYLNVPSEKIIEYFGTFKGLSHRSQVVATINEVVYINDSKATNVNSTAHALESHKRIHWIAGGLIKDGGVKTLKKSLSNVKEAYYFGNAAKRFALELGQIPHSVYSSLPEALKAASTKAKPGDTILLAPAAASFDQYNDFEERGMHFISEVNHIKNNL